MGNKKIIYSLVCPFTDEIHYIGKSTEGMLRPTQHLTESHSEKIKEWVNSLKEIGHTPTIKILEYVKKEEDLDGRERYWIQYYLNKGNNLLNSYLITPMMISPHLDELLGDGEELTMMKIGKFLKIRRKRVNVTQAEFAEKTGVALTVIRKIEQGKTNINLDGLLQVLKMFGCTLDVVKLK